MESKSRRTPRITAPADLSIARPASRSARPADFAKPAEASAPPPETSDLAAMPPSETPDAAAMPQSETPAPAPEPAFAPVPPELVVSRNLALAPLTASLPATVTAADPGVERDMFAVIAESRAALARAVESMSDELASYARHSIDASANTAIQLLAVTTWSDAVAVNAKFARTTYDQWLDSTAKVSELGVKLAYESAKPLMSRFERIWRGAGAG
jgi:hypothetical protein